MTNASKPRSAPATSKTSAPRTQTEGRTEGRSGAIVASAVVGAVAAAAFGALRLGWLDGLLRGKTAGGEHAAPDLAPNAGTPGSTRAPDAFRPDPTAPVPASERESLRPATGPAPTLAATAGEMANQTTPTNE